MLIEFTIDRFEQDKAILVESGGQAVVWPKNKLPGGTHEGSAVFFEIQNSEEREKQNRQTAKDIINEIINNP